MKLKYNPYKPDAIITHEGERYESATLNARAYPYPYACLYLPESQVGGETSKDPIVVTDGLDGYNPAIRKTWTPEGSETLLFEHLLQSGHPVVGIVFPGVLLNDTYFLLNMSAITKRGIDLAQEATKREAQKVGRSFGGALDWRLLRQFGGHGADNTILLHPAFELRFPYNLIFALGLEKFKLHKQMKSLLESEVDLYSLEFTEIPAMSERKGLMMSGLLTGEALQVAREVENVFMVHSRKDKIVSPKPIERLISEPGVFDLTLEGMGINHAGPQFHDPAFYLPTLIMNTVQEVREGDEYVSAKQQTASIKS